MYIPVTVKLDVHCVLRVTPPSLTTENLSCTSWMGAQIDPGNTASPWTSWKELSLEMQAEEGFASTVTSWEERRRCWVEQGEGVEERERKNKKSNSHITGCVTFTQVFALPVYNTPLPSHQNRVWSISDDLPTSIKCLNIKRGLEGKVCISRYTKSSHRDGINLQWSNGGDWRE